MILLISPYHDPRVNLSLEHLFLEEFSGSETKLFLYSNDPSVILGRFQNPWLECRPDYLKQEGIALVRRQSGGGTVYHDRGNLNFSFIGEQKSYDKIENLEFIARVMKKSELTLNINERQDLTINSKGVCYKVSGSAYRLKKDHYFHHGTLLIETSPIGLNKAISPDPQLGIINPKGTASVRSKVINLSELKPELSVARVIETFTKDRSFQSVIEERDSFWEKQIQSKVYKEEFDKLHTMTWTLEKTPSFQVQLTKDKSPNEHMLVKKGVIRETPSSMKQWLGKPFQEWCSFNHNQ